MKNKTILYWTSQILGWLVFYGFQGVNLYSQTDGFGESLLNNKSILLLFLLYIGSIGITHFMRIYFVRKKYIDLKITQILPRAILLSLLASFALRVYTILVDQYIVHFSSTEITTEYFLAELFKILLVMMLWCFLYFAYQYFDKSRREEIKNLQWEALKNQIELNNLKSQLNPHFMFNSLNSIRALIDIDKKDAKDSITKLSTLLRSSLLMGKKNVVTLSEEIELIKNYLDLEKIRFEERLSVQLDIDPTTLEFEIPPLMIQTLVENSIKHGISKKMDGGTIYLSTKKEDSRIKIEIRNPGKLQEGETNETSSSIGVKNTKDRLRLMFGSDAEFSLEQIGEEVKATIEIKAKRR